MLFCQLSDQHALLTSKTKLRPVCYTFQYSLVPSVSGMSSGHQMAVFFEAPKIDTFAIMGPMINKLFAKQHQRNTSLVVEDGQLLAEEAVLNAATGYQSHT